MRGAEYADLAAFVAVAQAHSFRRAASQLGISSSALSHSLRGLEDRLGATLLNRTTRSMALTEAGAELLARVAPAFADLSAAVSAVTARRSHPSGTVRLNVPRDAARIVLAPLLGPFGRAFPDVRLEVFVDDCLTDIVAGGFDAGIRMGERVQRDMVALRLTQALPMVIVGSPAYLASRPALRTPRDLKDHACIGYRQMSSHALARWTFEQHGERLDVAVESALILNDPDLALAAALEDVGLARCLGHTIAEHLASGRLVRVLEGWCTPFSGFFLYYPGQRPIPPALRAVIDFLRDNQVTLSDHV